MKDKELKALEARQKKREKERAQRKGYWCCGKAMDQVATLYGGESDCSCCSLDTELYQCKKCKTIKEV